MSSWQRLQESDAMKNLLGIFLCPYIWAELGKNGPLGPSPSWSMVEGGMTGFAMRARFTQRDSRRYVMPKPSPAASARHKARRRTEEACAFLIAPRGAANSAARKARAAALTRMCP